MSTINIKGGKDAPSIYLNEDMGILRIEGASFSENPYAIYGFVLEWIENSGFDTDLPLDCNFYYTYLNSSSKKLIYKMLVMLEDYYAEGKVVRINWAYDEFDDDMLELGHELAELIELPFKYIPKS